MAKAKPLPKPHRQWATIQKHKKARGGICLWGDRQAAEDGRDYDEDICLVRVEVIRIIKKD